MLLLAKGSAWVRFDICGEIFLMETGGKNGKKLDL
jgi:hypothetical protein